MNVTINRVELLAMLRKLCKIAPETSTAEMLTGVLVEADPDNLELTLTANNLETSLSLSLMAAIREGGHAVINARLFCGMLSRLDGDAVSLELHSTQFTLRSGTAYYTVMALPIQDFPIPQMPDDWQHTELSGLTSLVKQTVIAASKNQENMLLRCVNLELGIDQIRATSTDSVKLMSCLKKRPESASSTATLLIPADAFSLLAGIISDEQKFTVTWSTKTVAFQSDGFCFTTSLGTGEFINVDSVLASVERSYELLVDMAAFRAALSQIDVVGARQVTLSFSADGLQLSGEGTHGTAAVQTTAKAIQPIQNMLGFQFCYQLSSLLQCAAVLSGEVRISISKAGMMLISNMALTYFQPPQRKKPISIKKSKPVDPVLKKSKKTSKKAGQAA